MVKSIEVINKDSLKLSLDTLSVSSGDVIVLYVDLDEIDIDEGAAFARAAQRVFPKNEILVMPMNTMALQIVKKY